jgi:DNA mismatch repair protein MutS
VQKGTQFVFATHLHELMTIPEIVRLPTVVPYHLTVVADPRGIQRLVYDRQLKRGAGSPMYGLEVCRGLDMDVAFLERAMAFRKRLEGGGSTDAVSRYNARLPVQVCQVCGGKRALETHHIVPQQAADARGFIRTGVHKNHVGNLVVLCGDCHDKHHAGEQIIRGWVHTSVGRMLDVDVEDSDIVEED